jgi:hypothetical protein
VGVYVVGMHRSWTSALSRAVGLIIGYDGIEEATNGNDAGHWENPAVRSRLDRVLCSARATWAAPPVENLHWTGPLARHRRGMARLVTRLGDGEWVLKDPRLCLSLGAMLALPQPSASIVNIVRGPAEVASSLARRSGLPVEVGLALWERYVVGQLADQAAGGRSGYWLRQHELAEHPADVLAHLEGWLDDEGWTHQSAGLDAAVASVRPLAARRTDDAPVSTTPAQAALLAVVDDLAERRIAVPSPGDVPPLSDEASVTLELWRPQGMENWRRRELRRRLEPVSTVLRPIDSLRRTPGARSGA